MVKNLKMYFVEVHVPVGLFVEGFQITIVTWLFQINPTFILLLECRGTLKYNFE